MPSHLAIPKGATQIIVTGGLGTKTFDFTKHYDAAFVPDKIDLVKDYTADSDEAFVDWVRVWQKNETGYVVK